MTAYKQNPTLAQPAGPGEMNLVVNQIILNNLDLTPKDIRKLRQAMITALSVYIPNRVPLYDIYADIGIDGHLTGIIDKRFRAVLNKAMSFKKDDKKVDELDSLIGSETFRKMLRKLLETILWGITGLEFPPGKEFQFREINRKHIKPKWGIIAEKQMDQTGTPYADVSNLWIVGDADDIGILHKCAFYAIYKRGTIADWAQYIELFGQPMRIFKYDGNDPQTKEQLKKAAVEAGSSMSIMIPNQAEVEIKDGKQSNGDGKLQATFKDAMNAEMSVIILGNTETTTSSSSSGYAQSKTHAEQQLEVTKDDLVMVENLLNSDKFLQILDSFGYPVAGGRFEFDPDVDMNAIDKKMDIIKKAKKELGVPVDDEHIYHTSGIPKPANYDQLKEEAKQLVNPNKPPKDPEKPDDQEDLADVSPAKEKPLRKLLRSLSDFFAPAPANPGHLTTSLADIYASRCPVCNGQRVPDLADSGFDAIINQVAADLFNSRVATGAIPYDLYRNSADRLMSAVFEGLGGKTFDFTDNTNELRAYLEHNVHAFSAAKSLTELQHIRSLMIGPNGKPVDWVTFRNAVTDAGYQFNVNYLATEYDTALTSAQMALKWEELKVLDLIQFTTAGDGKVRPSHAKFDRFTAAPSDPIWRKITPPLDWKCRCNLIPGVAHNHKAENNIDQLVREANIPAYFQNNPAETKTIFNDAHPYFKASGMKLKDLSAANYAMQSIERLYAKNTFIAPVEFGLRDEANAWWSAQAGTAGGTIETVDVTGNVVQLETAFREAVLTKDRFAYLGNAQDIFRNPDEVWSYKEKGILKKVYLKYYDGRPMGIQVTGTKGTNMIQYIKADGSVNLDAVEKARKGALLYRKN